MGKLEYYTWLGETLKAHRLNNNLTLEDVALKLDVTKKQIQHWETAQRKLTVPSLVELCKVYNINPSDIFEESLKHLDW